MLRSSKRPGTSPLHVSTQPACPDESLEGKSHGKKGGWGKKIAGAGTLLAAATIGIGAAIMTISGRPDALCWTFGVGCNGVSGAPRPSAPQSHVDVTSSINSLPTSANRGLRRAKFTTRTSSRHPEYTFNTPEYKQKCAWTYTSKVRKPCTFLVRPNPKSGEGMASWISAVAMGYIYSVQAGCQLQISYGPSVEVDRVWSPPASVPAGQKWVVPPGYECSEEERCMDVFGIGTGTISKFLHKTTGSTKPLASVPHYRMAYSRQDNETDAIERLKGVLLGFEYETGFACALGRLFELPQSAAEYVPDLFTNLLPTLRDPTSLVMTIYVRTGRTDDVARIEKHGKTGGMYHNHTHIDAGLMSCALSTEEQRLHDSNGKFANVVWLVITDSPSISKAIIDQYSGKEESSSDGKTIPRKVITTSSQGIQTRPARDPSTSDFADAALDWFLIGEADVLVTLGATSFGTTAALRTAMPLYMYTANNGECALRHLDNDGSAVLPGFVQVSMKKGGKADILAALKAQGFTINGKPIVGAKRIPSS